jgi:hypothetical protein
LQEAKAGDSKMTDKIITDDLNGKFQDINDELIDHLTKINIEKGLPVWEEHRRREGQVVCGVGFTFMWVRSILKPEREKELVKKYAGRLKEIMASSYNLVDLKKAVKWVIDYELVNPQKAIMFGLPALFWAYLTDLTDRAYGIVTEGLTKRTEYRDDYEEIEDGEFKRMLPATVIKLNEQDERDREIDEKRWRDSLDPRDRKILEDWEAGYGVRYSAKGLGIKDKNVVAKKRKELKKSKRKKLDEDENEDKD